MELIRIAHVGPRFFADLRNRCRIQPANFGKHSFRQHAAHFHRPGAAFFERGVIEIRIRIRIKNFVGKLRRNRSLHGDAADCPRSYSIQDILQAFDVHRFRKSFLHRLARQRMIRNGNFALYVLLASECLRKHSGQEIVGTHALNLRRNFFPAHETKQCKGAAGNPAPASGEDRRRQHSLFKQRFDGGGLQKVKHIGEWKTVLVAQRDI